MHQFSMENEEIRSEGLKNNIKSSTNHQQWDSKATLIEDTQVTINDKNKTQPHKIKNI
jgi:hypothetical protein